MSDNGIDFIKSRLFEELTSKEVFDSIERALIESKEVDFKRLYRKVFKFGIYPLKDIEYYKEKRSLNNGK